MQSPALEKEISHQFAKLDPVKEFLLKKDGKPTPYAKSLEKYGPEQKLGASLSFEPIRIKETKEISEEDLRDIVNIPTQNLEVKSEMKITDNF